MNENNKLKSKELIIELLALVDADKRPQLEILLEQVPKVYLSCFNDSIRVKKTGRFGSFCRKMQSSGRCQMNHEHSFLFDAHRWPEHSELVDYLEQFFSEIQTFQSILKPLSIHPEILQIALNAVKEHLKPSVSAIPQKERLISRKEVAELLCCCTRTVDRLRQNGTLSIVNYGTASIRYRESDVIALMESREIL